MNYKSSGVGRRIEKESPSVLNDCSSDYEPSRHQHHHPLFRNPPLSATSTLLFSFYYSEPLNVTHGHIQLWIFMPVWCPPTCFFFFCLFHCTMLGSEAQIWAEMTFKIPLHVYIWGLRLTWQLWNKRGTKHPPAWPSVPDICFEV